MVYDVARMYAPVKFQSVDLAITEKAQPLLRLILAVLSTYRKWRARKVCSQTGLSIYSVERVAF